MGMTPSLFFCRGMVQCILLLIHESNALEMDLWCLLFFQYWHLLGGLLWTWNRNYMD